jgi:predicted transcriptional regulator
VPKRTTLTLDDDVAAKLSAEAIRTGRPYRTVVNEALRSGLESGGRVPKKRFKVRASAMGLRPGMAIDSIAGLIEELDGPWPR